MNYNRLNFLSDLDSLIPIGFKRQHEVPLYKEVELGRELIIQVSTRDYFPHGVYVNGIIVNINVESIERIYQDALNANPLPSSVLQSPNTLNKVLNDIDEIDYSQLEQEIKDELSFNSVGKTIRKIIQVGAVPFFNKYQTAYDIKKSTDEMEIEDIVNFIGQPLPFRQMIIKKLSNDNQYLNYVEMVLDYYKYENLLTEYSFAETLKNTLSKVS